MSMFPILAPKGLCGLLGVPILPEGVAVLLLPASQLSGGPGASGLCPALTWVTPGLAPTQMSTVLLFNRIIITLEDIRPERVWQGTHTNVHLHHW